MLWRLLLFLAVAGAAIAGLGYGLVGAAPTASVGRVALPVGWPKPLPAAHHRILLLGTSLTRRGDWPELLEERLRQCATAPLMVERLAQAGAASGWGLEALRARLAEAPAPTIIVVEFSGNDASIIHGFPLFVSRHHHREILQHARDAGALPILATMSPAWGWKALARPGQRRYHALYRDLARSEGTGLIDTISDWRALPLAARRQALPDNLHPTPAAMEAITVPAFEAALRPLVCREAPGTDSETKASLLDKNAGRL